MIQQLFAEYLRQSALERGLSARTIQGYRDSLKLYLQFLQIEDGPVSRLTTEFVRNFLIHGREMRNWSPRTWHIHHSNLNVFCQWLCDHQYLRTNPVKVIGKPRLATVIRQALTSAQVHKLLYVALTKSSRHPFLRIRNHALLMLPLHTGLRMSEVLALQLSHLQLSSNLVHVVQGKGGKDRQVRMSDDLVASLQVYLSEHARYYNQSVLHLFPSKSGQRLVVREYRRLTDLISQLSGIKFSSHDLRRSYATGLSRANVSPFIIQRQLGHSDIKVTMRYVTHVQEDIERAIAGLDLYGG